MTVVSTREITIQESFFQAWEKPFKCDDCEFSKMYSQTRDLFVAREYRYHSILEKIAQMVNPGSGMNGKSYDELPKMLENLLDTSGDKAKLKAQVSYLTKENETLALQMVRKSYLEQSTSEIQEGEK